MNAAQGVGCRNTALGLLPAATAKAAAPVAPKPPVDREMRRT
jgi:hypothetical protein